MSDNNYEAVGRAVERLSGREVRVVWDPYNPPLHRAETGDHTSYRPTPGDALIALADAVAPSWETRLRERCAELGMTPRRGSFGGVSVWQDGAFVLSVAHTADHETACRAALAALDMLHPREES